MNVDDENDDEDLRRALAIHTPIAPIADDGFTDRVMARLPPRPRRSRRGAVLGATLALTLVVLWLSPATSFVSNVIIGALVSGGGSIAMMISAVVLLGMMVCAGTYAASPD
jgi:hypothetical protein